MNNQKPLEENTMHPNHYTINATDLYLYAATVLQAQLRWRDYGPKCTAIRLLGVLFYAAAQLVSVCAACNRLREAPTDQAVRAALVALCPEPAVLERQFNRSFASQLPKALRRRLSRLAIDVTLIPYHGRPHQRLEEIYRSQAKSGTTPFHAYATCYIVHKGQRFTVALMRVERGTTRVSVLKQLLRTARSAGVRPRLWLLDRGFYSVEVIRYLQAARYPFLMPVICRGRKPSDPRGPSGTYGFATHQHHGRARYTLTNADGQTATVQICIHCRNWAGDEAARDVRPWSMPIGACSPRPRSGSTRPTGCASALRPVIVNSSRRGSKLPRAPQRYGFFLLVSHFCCAMPGSECTGIGSLHHAVAVAS